MSEETIIRPATTGDANDVAEVYLTSRKTFLHFAPLAHSDHDIREWIARVLIPSGRVTVATLGGKLVGMMAVSSDEECDWIDQLYLHPAATGRGIGGRLLEQAKQELGPLIRLYTFQANAGSRRFYERQEFRAVAFSDGVGNEERCPDVRYEMDRR